VPPRFTALAIIFAIVVFGSALGLSAGARHKMSLEQWTVAGRGFGVLLMWLLMAGEVYTTFAFLGASGWAYSRGGPTLYILAYLTLAYVVSFFILPPIWELGRKHHLQTGADFFSARYGSRTLAVVVSVIGLVFIVPYLQLQLTGLGIIVEIASFDGIGRAPAMAIAAALVAAFVFTGGVRAVAWVSVLKDILMLSAALAIGIGVPRVWFGGIGPMFAALARARPAHLVMPGATQNLGHAWYISTVLLTSLGFYMWPHAFGAAFTARSGETLRRNAVLMPLYTVTLVFILFAGFAAVLVIPGISNGDLALLTVVRKTFPPWFLGVVGGAGALTAMVPAAILLLTASAIFAKNIFRPLFAPDMADDRVALLARVVVVVLGLVSLYLAIYSSMTAGFAAAARLRRRDAILPRRRLRLIWRRANAAAVLAGMLAGIAAVAVLALTNRDPYHGLNAGFLALCLNFAVTVVLSWLREAILQSKQAAHL